jgi:hydrogenase maturation protease
VILVGGVGELFQGDLDLGRVAVERLSAEPLGRDVLVEDLYYGAVAVVHRLEELQPSALVVVGASERGRPPGTVQRRRIEGLRLDPEQVQRSVQDAGTGYVTIDLLVDVAWGLGSLPARTVAIEVEPAVIGPIAELSEVAARALEDAVALVRREVGRLPLLGLADTLRATADDGHIERTAALDALEALLGELRLLDAEGRWGRTFAERDRLRAAIGAGETGEGMEHLDWGLWWTLIEELDRLQAVEGATV